MKILMSAFSQGSESWHRVEHGPGNRSSGARGGRAHANVGLGIAEIVETKVVPRAPGESFKLLYAGRLLYWKGVHLAIRALASARSPGTDATLTLVGSGPARRDLEELLCEVLPEGSYEASALQADGRKARPRKRRANQQPWQLKETATPLSFGQKQGMTQS